jgi:uncharacterized protein (TIRG00374 family)
VTTEKKRNKGIFVLVKILVSLVILFLLFKNTDTGLFFETITSINPIFFVLAILLFVTSQVISTYRWSLFLRYGGLDMSYFKLLSLYFIGMFFNNFLPTAVGGDLVKGYFLYKASGKGGISLASIFVDRYVGFASLVVLAFIALFLGYSYISDTLLPWFVLLFICLFSLVSLFLWIEKLHNWAFFVLDKITFFNINEKIEKFYQALMNYRKYPQVLMTGLGISLILQTLGVLTFYVISKGFGMTVPLLLFFLFIPLALTVSMIPVSLAGLGLREGAFVFLFAKIGVSSASALSLSLTWFIVVVISSLFGCIEYIRMGQHIKMEEMDDIKG